MFVIKIVKQKKLKRRPNFLIFLFRNGKKLKFLGNFIFRKGLKFLKFDLEYFFSYLLRTNLNIKKRVFKLVYKLLIEKRFNY